MNFLKVRDIYMKMCHQSKELHVLSDEERKQLQAHFRKMYVDLEKVCNAHNLTIMLACGSVLGAVRHGGFIPWDDDFDVFMPREDYNKLLYQYADELPSNYIIDGPNCKYGPTYQFAKLRDINTEYVFVGEEHSDFKGIKIDIFPLENIATSKYSTFFKHYISLILIGISASVAQYESKSVLYRKLMSGCLQARFAYWLRQIIGWAFSFRTSKWWYSYFDSFVQYRKKTGYMHDPSNNYTWNPIPEDVFLPVKRVKFDDIEVNIPNNSEYLLIRDYGDWHYIPKPEERWEHFCVSIKFSKNIVES